MKRTITTSLLGAVLLLPVTSSCFADDATTSNVIVKPAASTTNYTLDEAHSSVLWHIDHFGFSHPSGKWLANGTLIIDENHPVNSKVTATIKLDTIDTGIPKLDEHLRSKAFFDVAQFPTATFTSDKVTVTGKNTAKVHGILNLHGVSKPVTLDVTLNKIGINPITTKQAIGFTAKTTIKRSDFDITTLLPSLGDTVKLDIEAEGQASG